MLLRFTEVGSSIYNKEYDAIDFVKPDNSSLCHICSVIRASLLSVGKEVVKFALNCTAVDEVVWLKSY